MTTSTHAADTSMDGVRIDTTRAAMQQALRLIEDEGHKADLLEAASILRAALAEQKCPCGDRPADQCPGEWEPGCDLGANEKHAKVATADASLGAAIEAIDAALAEQAQPVAECIDDICSEHSGRVEAFDHLPAGTKLYTTPPAPLRPRCCAGWGAAMSERSEALRLADELGAEIERTVQVDMLHHNAAAELRRLHAENEALRALPQPLTEREVELIDGMIEVQLQHAAQCDLMLARAGGNHIMAERQKGWDMERVELLRKIRSMGVQR